MSGRFLIVLFYLTSFVAHAGEQQPLFPSATTNKDAPLDVDVELGSETLDKPALPMTLLLKCEGEVGTLGGRVPDFGKFETTLELRSGELIDLFRPSFTTKGCGLGVTGIVCSEQAVVPNKIGSRSELRVLKAYIARETGKYSHHLLVRSFKARNPTGMEIGDLERFVRRTGVCRTISKPIF